MSRSIFDSSISFSVRSSAPLASLWTFRKLGDSFKDSKLPLLERTVSLTKENEQKLEFFIINVVNNEQE